MKINATAYLYYNEGESISSGWEGLWLYVKFKEEGNFFKTKLKRTLVSTWNVANAHLCNEEDRIDTYDDYYQHVKEIVEHRDQLQEVVVEMVQEHFENKDNDFKKVKDKKELANKVNNLPKFEVTVEIK